MKASAGSTSSFVCGGLLGGDSSNDFNVTSSGSSHSHSIITPVFNSSLSTTGETETRPINVALVYIIKHWDF